jgi:L-ascorbate metabolism protein UlaG (beta-lactamase superfamily)
MSIEDNIFWVGHACFYIKTKDATVFIDPFRIGDSIKEKADLVLITHAHSDHNSKQDIDRVAKADTKFIAANKCAEEKSYTKIGLSKPGFKTKFGNIGIEAVHAYNTKDERLKFHPRSENWVGYILDIDGTRIYHAGDTDSIPEMDRLKDIDIALLPMGGAYTMAMDEAIDAVKRFGPKRVVPMHYKMLLGKEGSAEFERSIRSKLGNVHIMREVQESIYSF